MSASAKAYNNFLRPYPGPISIYVHFPFCRGGCAYCDFYKERFDPSRVERFFRALNYETEMVLSSFGHEPIDIASIYVGGGTPSLINPGFLEKWLGVLSGYVRFLPDYEFTIEANPELLADGFFGGIHRLGVNRVVIGVQSFGVKILRRLARKVTVKEIYRAFYLCRAAGIDNIGGDLIFGLPGQRVKQVKGDIERLTALEPNHISLYQLTVEDGTPLARDIASSKIELPDEDTLAEMYRMGSHMLIDRGYRRYEVSNFAREGWRSRHNYAYWNGAPYVALGPAAHGFVNNHRYANIPLLEKYIETLEAGFMPISFTEELTEDQRLTEEIMLSLRTAEGIDKEKLLHHYGDKARNILQSNAIKKFIEERYLLNEHGFIRLTDDGFLVADSIIMDLTG